MSTDRQKRIPLDTPFHKWLGNCPSRVLNALKRAGKHTLRDVVSMSESEVRGLRNLGQTSFYALKHELSILGLSLGCAPAAEPVKLAEVSLRDYFAGQAMAGLLANRTNGEKDRAALAAIAYGFADSMLDERLGRAATVSKTLLEAPA
jgi:hypothetical protein